MRRTPRDGSGTGHGHVAQGDLLTPQKSGQFPDELIRIKDAQIHHVYSPRRTSNSRHKGDSVRAMIIVVSALLSG